MRAKTKKKLTVLFSTACAAMLAATGASALVNTKAMADEAGTPPPAATEKALYFVDCGYTVANADGTGDLLTRSGTAGYPAKTVTPFMTEYNLSYGTSEGGGLYNSVTDRPYVSASTDNNTADPVTGKIWGFDYVKNGSSNYGNVGHSWRTWAYGATDTGSLTSADYGNYGKPGFQTIRYVEGNRADNWEGSLVYTFEVDDATTPLRLQFGTAGAAQNWGDQKFHVSVNGTQSSTEYNAPQRNTGEYVYDNEVKGVERDGKYFVTVSFGNEAEQPFISYILLTTENYASRFEEETSCVKNSAASTVKLTPKMTSTTSPNYDYYVQGTITEETKTALDAANDWTYVDGSVTTSDGIVTNAKILALPSNTAYFVDAGNDAKYGAEHGYGWTTYEGSENNRWVKSAYNETLRYVAANGAISYQFDSLPAGTYGITVGAQDPWETRYTEIWMNGAKGSNVLQCQKDVKTSATNYTTLSADGNLTVDLKRQDGSNGPAFTYIHVFKAAKATFNPNYDGGSDSSVSVGLGEKVAKPADPVRTNYQFEGWYKEAACENAFDFENETVSADITLYAKWTEATPRTVTFKNGDETIKTVENVTHGTTLAETDIPEAPSKGDGSAFFGGWKTESGVKFDPATDAVTADLTLTPIWIPNPLAAEEGYTVAENTGSGDGMSLISYWRGDAHHGGKDIYLVKGTTTVVVLTANGGNNKDKGLMMSVANPAKNKLANFTGGSVYGFDQYNATNKQAGSWNNAFNTDTASGSKSDFTISVKYDPDTAARDNAYQSNVLQVGKATLKENGVIEYVVETYAATDTSYVNLLCKVTYTITIPDFNGDEYSVTFAFDPTTSNATYGSASLKYYTLNNTEYKVSFSADGGSEVGEQSVRGTSKATKPADPTKEGYAFKGWYKDSSFGTEFDFDTPITENTTVYAKWAQVFTVSFDSNGAGEVAAQTVEKDQKASGPAALTRKGYTFEGWYNGESETQFDFNTPITANIVLTAKWTAKTYAITLDIQGGTYNGGTLPSLTFTYGAEIAGLPTVENMTKAGSVFRGWYTTQDTEGEHSHLRNGMIWAPEEADTLQVTLYAHWGDTYSVDFELNGGEGAFPTQEIEPGQKATKPETDPTRTGYTFAGWYTSAGEIFDFETPIQNGYVLQAHWTINTYTVTFDSQGGSAVEAATVDYNATVTKPADPAKEGYAFGGWYTDAECTAAFDFNGAITANVTVYAKWTINTYTVTFDSQGGSAVEAATVDYNATVTKPADPAKEGYAFGGWYTDAECTAAFDFNGAITADVTLYAKWEPATVTPPKEDKGCGSAISSSLAIVGGMLALGTAAIVIKKKKTDK